MNLKGSYGIFYLLIFAPEIHQRLMNKHLIGLSAFIVFCLSSYANDRQKKDAVYSLGSISFRLQLSGMSQN